MIVTTGPVLTGRFRPTERTAAALMLAGSPISLLSLPVKVLMDAVQGDEEIFEQKKILDFLADSSTAGEEGLSDVRISCFSRLTPILKVWRGRCARERLPFQNKLREVGCLSRLVEVLLTFPRDPDETSAGFFHLLLTLLTNAITSNEENQRYVWQRMPLGSIASLLSRFERFVAIREVFYFFIYNSVATLADHRSRLLQSENGFLDALMLDLKSTSTSDDGTHEAALFDWALFIFKVLVNDEFIIFWRSLSKEGILSDSQCVALSIIESSPNILLKHSGLVSLIDVLQRLLQLLFSPRISEDSVLAIFHLLSIFGARTSGDDLDVNEVLFEFGLLRLVVSVIKQIHDADVKFKLETGHSSSFEANRFRGDLMRICANLCFANKAAQDQVYDEGGLPAILGSCVIDDRSPLLREWSVLALRNICLFNPRNQAFLSALQAQDIPEHVRRDLAKKGIDVQVGEDGKVKVKQLVTEDVDHSAEKK